jgi:hypothetical protein
VETLVRIALQALAGEPAYRPAPLPVRPAWITRACSVALGVAGSGALGCAIAALWIFLRPMIGQAGAALAACAALLLVFAIAVIVLKTTQRHVIPPAPPPRLAPAAGLLISDAGRLVRQHRLEALLVPLVAGLVLASAERRRPVPTRVIQG